MATRDRPIVTRPAEELVPGGRRPPDHIPADVFASAVETFAEGRRLDMGELAERLGWSRATLYRKAPPREELLGHVVWFLTRLTLIEAIEETGTLRGSERIAKGTERFLRSVSGQAPFRRLLEHEPQLALRVLTSKHGPVQAGMTQAVEALLRDEEAKGALALSVDAHTLAYAIVRIGEGFLYADLVADEANDPERAGRVIGLLLSPLDR